MRVMNNHTATHFSVDISTKRQAASFHFVELTGDVRVVTVPLMALGRLHREITERLVTEPQLFDGSKQ